MRKNYSGYTRVIKQKLQSYFDISTSTDGYQVLQFNCGGNDLLPRMPGMFGSFKYFKLGNLKVVAVPQSTLPVDPTGLSYEQGENTVDPRDQLTPGLIRITNGEDMRGFNSGVQSIGDGEYNAMMLDPRWYKFMLQSGFRRSCSPKFWGVGTIAQNDYPGTRINQPTANQVSPFVQNIVPSLENGLRGDPTWVADGVSHPDSLFLTGQKIRMGWLPTDTINPIFGLNNFGQKATIHAVPECQCITVILPKARKTKYYYRVFVTETVYFKDPVVRSPATDYGGSVSIYNPIDYQNTLRLGGMGYLDPTDDSSDTDGGTVALPDQNTGDNGGVN